MKKIIAISLFFCIFISSFVFAQEAVKNVGQDGILTSNDFVKNSDLINFQQNSIWQLATINFTLLGICVAIILVFFGIFYFFSFSPVQKKIEEQEKGIGELKKEMEAKISELNETQRKELENFKNIIEIKFKENNEESKKNIRQELFVEIENAKKIINEIEQKANKSIEILEKKYQQLDLMATWNEHYIWKYAKVTQNVMTCLIQCLQKEVKYKTTDFVSLVLRTFIYEIDTFRPFYTDKTQLDLIELFKQISGFEDQKKEILEKGKKIIEGKKSSRAL